MENNVEKQTPFLKRVSDLEKAVTRLEKKLDTILKSLKR